MQDEKEGFLEKNRGDRRSNLAGRRRDSERKVKRVEHKDKWRFNPNQVYDGDEDEDGEE